MSEVTIGLIGATIGAVPAILGILIPWLRARDYVSRSTRRIELAKKRVDFLDCWLNGKLAAGTEDKSMLRQRVSIQLDSIFDSVSDVLNPDDLIVERSGVVPDISGNQNTQSPPATGSGRISRGVGTKSRTGFFITLGFLCFMTFGASIDDANNSSLTHLVNEIKENWEVLALFAIPPAIFFIFWRWALRRARKRGRR